MILLTTLFFATHNYSLVSSCSFMALNTIALLTTPKFMSPAQTSALNSRLMHHCLLTLSTFLLNKHLRLNMSQTLTTPHTSCKCSLFSLLRSTSILVTVFPLTSHIPYPDLHAIRISLLSEHIYILITSTILILGQSHHLIWILQ